ncbi:MAG: anhydro-N-acetylmuramic acid kinase [Phycisphaerales bacterium JB040]
MTDRPRLAIGCMTGTSLDGLDLAAVRVTGQGNLRRAEVVAVSSFGLGTPADGLRALASGEPMTPADIAELRWSFGERHAECLSGFLGTLDARPGLVTVHGQTVFHGRSPADRHRTWQLLEPAPIARALGLPVVSNLRAADVAAGGQGAPITPLADALLFADAPRPCVIVNLGGFCNATLLHQDGSVEGFDLCACNRVLDAAARAGLGLAFDPDGLRAKEAISEPRAADELRTILSRQAGLGRSLGQGDEASDWVERWRGSISGPSLCASGTEAVGRTIAETLLARVPEPARVVLAGGGARNLALLEELRLGGLPDERVVTADRIGVPIEGREAAGMAVLGTLSLLGEPVTLARITGCTPAGADDAGPIAGDWTLPPGGGWRMIEHA